MALYDLFENKNSLLFIDFICLLFNLQMCEIILYNVKSFLFVNLFFFFILFLVLRKYCHSFYFCRIENDLSLISYLFNERSP